MEGVDTATRGGLVRLWDGGTGGDVLRGLDRPWDADGEETWRCLGDMEGGDVDRGRQAPALLVTGRLASEWPGGMTRRTWGAERARALAMDSVVQPLILSSGLPRGTEARLLRGGLKAEGISS